LQQYLYLFEHKKTRKQPPALVYPVGI